MESDYNDKVSRVLSLYQRLMEGEVIDKEVEATKYGVSEIKKLRNYRKVRIKRKESILYAWKGYGTQLSLKIFG